MLDARVPRVLTALLAGAALALSGTLVQAVTRNPLAEPGILGVSGGAALGAVLLVTTVPAAATWGIAGAAFAGAAVASVVVFGLAARGGFGSNRLVLVGVGVSAATTALIILFIVLTDLFNATKTLTWLSGSTYGRELPDARPDSSPDSGRWAARPCWSGPYSIRQPGSRRTGTRRGAVRASIVMIRRCTGRTAGCRPGVPRPGPFEVRDPRTADRGGGSV
ncbi:hypothetical protein ADL25_05060 [Streptomyces sp. NRRL F-5122]|nr:hypothetical protein ADL25_05060 [Streptomyces sp. NRRL F-5122]